ncbi:MAG: ferredoxin [Candidatus Omnitrophica bacterium]|nr:ferredoxin [Candidatus Omnitrophota bacterium]MDE2009126.1 ferredoxin [Candidatus Omnitrophota bacterium]MDE2214209.1 ferredoxin [Candidatus Omnitrophota bacterium]MDE2231246.1 ferredoxin [Candidatus Omnitrophota bacterium]
MKYKWLPVFDADNCSQCRACAPACLCGAIKLSEGSIRFDPELCCSSGRCIDSCPIGGIHMEWVPFFGDAGHGLVRA